MDPGEIVDGRYHLRERLGQGGMAEVWQAYDSRRGHGVAVKFVRIERAHLDGSDAEEHLHRRDEFRKRFQREARLLGTLHHPGIPELYGQGSHRGEPYIAMQLVEGPQLKTFHDRHRPLNTAVAVAIAAQIADALACAHAAPVVHRDLNPRNVLLQPDGTVALIDFGIARPLQEGATTLTAEGVTLGSNGYMAPEQILQETVRERADLYAFGCVFYELLVGRPPFTMGGDTGAVGQHLNDPPVPPSHYVEVIPEDIDRLILKLLEKKPQDRPRDAAAVHRSLRPFAPRPGSPTPLPRLQPDPTRPFRAPEISGGPPSPAAQWPARRPSSRRTGRWLSKADSARLVEEAASVIDTGESLEPLIRLERLLPAARREWGVRDADYQRMRTVCADGLRIAGEGERALPLYRQLIDDLGDSPETGDRVAALVARLDIAECHAQVGRFGDALAGLRDAAVGMETLAAEVAQPLVKRCREVGLVLSESGYSNEVRETLPWCG